MSEYPTLCAFDDCPEGYPLADPGDAIGCRVCRLRAGIEGPTMEARIEADQRARDAAILARFEAFKASRGIK